MAVIWKKLALDDEIVRKDTFNAKGDILTATADDTPTILSAGSDEQVLVADSGESSGLKWKNAKKIKDTVNVKTSDYDIPISELGEYFVMDRGSIAFFNLPEVTADDKGSRVNIATVGEGRTYIQPEEGGIINGYPNVNSNHPYAHIELMVLDEAKWIINDTEGNLQGDSQYGAWVTKEEDIYKTLGVYGTPTGVLNYRIWNTETDSFGDEIEISQVTGSIKWVDLKHSPVTAEHVMVSVNSSESLSVKTFDGESWTENFSRTIGSSAYKSFAVTYEFLTGNVMVVFTDGSKNVKYRRRIDGTWDSSDTTIATLTDNPCFVELQVCRESNNIFLGVSDDGDNLNLWRWDGTSESWGNNLVITSISDGTTKCFSMSCQTSTCDLYVFYGNQTADLKYRRWTTSWQSEQEADGVLHNDAYFVQSTSDPDEGSAYLAVVVITLGNPRGRAEFELFNGSSWETPPDALDTSLKGNYVADVSFEFDSNKAIYVFFDTNADDQFSWRSWTSVGGFSAVTNETGITGQLRTIKLDPSKDSNEMLVLYSDGLSDLYYRYWNSSTWSSLGSALETTLGDKDQLCYDVSWYEVE